MTKNEAFKAMLDGKKVTHRNYRSTIYLFYDVGNRQFLYHSIARDKNEILFTADQFEDGYELLKEKVTKYLFLYRDVKGYYKVTHCYYKNDEEVERSVGIGCTVISRIDDSAKEIEV